MSPGRGVVEEITQKPSERQERPFLGQTERDLKGRAAANMFLTMHGFARARA